MSRGQSLKLIYSSDLHNASWDFSFLLLPVSSPLPHITASHHTLQLFKVSAPPSPHTKPAAQAMQTEASPLWLLSVCFHISLTSVSPPPSCFCCFCPCQGLLCFSFSWPWLHKLLLPLLILLPVPPLCQASILWALSQSPLFWLHCEIGVSSIYSQAGVVGRTWWEDTPERGKPGSCCGWIRRMVSVGELFMSSHNLSSWAMHPASCLE